MKIYIAGKITGDLSYKRKFNSRARDLEDMGHIVLNQATLPEGMAPENYMAICLPMLLQADAIYMLPDYTKSEGAYIEMLLAKYVGKPVHFVLSDFIKNAAFGGANTESGEVQAKA